MPCTSGSVARSAVWPGFVCCCRKEKKSVVSFRPWSESEAVGRTEKGQGGVRVR